MKIIFRLRVARKWSSHGDFYFIFMNETEREKIHKIHDCDSTRCLQWQRQMTVICHSPWANQALREERIMRCWDKCAIYRPLVEEVTNLFCHVSLHTAYASYNKPTNTTNLEARRKRIARITEKCDNKNEIYDLRLVIYLCANLLLQMVHVSYVSFENDKNKKKRERNSLHNKGGEKRTFFFCWQWYWFSLSVLYCIVYIFVEKTIASPTKKEGWR